jgi:hypothetical protein
MFIDAHHHPNHPNPSFIGKKLNYLIAKPYGHRVAFLIFVLIIASAVPSIVELATQSEYVSSSVRLAIMFVDFVLIWIGLVWLTLPRENKIAEKIDHLVEEDPELANKIKSAQDVECKAQCKEFESEAYTNCYERCMNNIKLKDDIHTGTIFKVAGLLLFATAAVVIWLPFVPDAPANCTGDGAYYKWYCRTVCFVSRENTCKPKNIDLLRNRASISDTFANVKQSCKNNCAAPSDGW